MPCINAFTIYNSRQHPKVNFFQEKLLVNYNMKKVGMLQMSSLLYICIKRHYLITCQNKMNQMDIICLLLGNKKRMNFAV